MDEANDNPAMTAADLKRWRAELGLSQPKAAAMLGLSHRTITAYERGEWAIPLSVVYACQYLLDQWRSRPSLAEPGPDNLARLRYEYTDEEVGELIQQRLLYTGVVLRDRLVLVNLESSDPEAAGWHVLPEEELAALALRCGLDDEPV